MFETEIFEKQNKLVLLPEEFETICRSCLSRNGLINVFEGNHKEILFSDLLAMLSLLQLDSTDDLPKKICTGCADLLTQFYTFKETVQQSQIILQNSVTKIIEPKCEFNENFYNECGNLDNDVSDDKNDQKQIEITPKRNRKQNLTCSFCSTKFDTYSAYIAHRKSEADLRRNKQSCTVCTKLISTHKLKDHMNSHTKERPYQCQICFEKFRFRSSLSRHKFRHRDKKPHVCHICGKGFIQAPTLADHIRTHSGEKSGICNICGKSFVTKHALGNHINMHKIKDGKTDSNNFICKNCKQTFISEEDLKQHIFTQHEKEFLCSDCGKKFSTKALLNSHVKIHSEVKPYTCYVCTKAFFQKNSLLKHTRTHTGEKPILCIVCGKRFSQKGHLTYHMRKHSGERPYSCDFCNKTFNHMGSLKIHTRIHTGEKPFTCEICSKGFYDSSSMKKHKKVHEETKEIQQHFLDTNECCR